MPKPLRLLSGVLFEERAMNRINDYANGLRELADFLDAHPVLGEECPFYGETINIFARDAETFARLAAVVGGEKDAYSDWAMVKRNFSGGVSLHLNCAREKVCTRVSKGKTTITRPIMKQVGEETVEIEEFEWDCPKSFLGLASHSEPNEGHVSQVIAEAEAVQAMPT